MRISCCGDRWTKIPKKSFLSNISISSRVLVGIASLLVYGLTSGRIRLLNRLVICGLRLVLLLIRGLLGRLILFWIFGMRMGLVLMFPCDCCLVGSGRLMLFLFYFYVFLDLSVYFLWLLLVDMLIGVLLV